MELTSSFESLLRNFAPVFTEPSFATFRLLMTGWILSTRHRYGVIRDRLPEQYRPRFDDYTGIREFKQLVP